jgi:hypothetical protein
MKFTFRHATIAWRDTFLVQRNSRVLLCLRRSCRLVNDIPVIADNYEQTKNIIRSEYGDKNRIIQAHLDYLEHLSPTLHDEPESLNTMYVECHRQI